MAIKKGDVVVVEYTGKFDDGNIFDSSVGKKPLEFEVGSGMVIKGFEDAVIGMKKGEEKEFKIKAENAYGNRNENLVKEIPRNVLPENMEIKKGMILMMRIPDGRQIASVIKEIKEKTLIIDLNHPLAGKDLNFKIKILDVK